MIKDMSTEKLKGEILLTGFNMLKVGEGQEKRL